MSKGKHYHLMRDIPNNFITRWIVKKVNKRMSDSESYYRLEKRYRKPREGYMYDTFGGIVRRNSNDLSEIPPVYKRAKVFSLYLRNR